MADNTPIEWTDATWNPITGCSVVSPGCTNCYAMKLAGGRLRHHPSRQGLIRDSKAGPVWTGEVRFNEDAINWPISWKGAKEAREEGRRSRIFVCAHGDLFHESVPDAWIDRVFAVMALSPGHDFQVLTKRADRMRDYITRMGSAFGADEERQRITDAVNEALMRSGRSWGYCGSTSSSITTISQPLGAREPWMLRRMADGGVERLVAWTPQERWSRVSDQFAATLGVLQVWDREFGWGLKRWPLPNVWLGVSVEDQVRADERRPPLAELASDGWTTFVSYEPALGPVDWSGWEFLKWLISGGDSGPGARPSHPAWHRRACDFCAQHAIAFLFKQWGAWLPWLQFNEAGVKDPNPEQSRFDAVIWDPEENRWEQHGGGWQDDPGAEGPDDLEQIMGRVGKKAAGRLLDGVTHDGFPEVR